MNSIVQNNRNINNDNNNDNTIWGVCIPKVEDTLSSEYIKCIMEKTKMGSIKQYTELAWKNDPRYKRILMRIQVSSTNENIGLWKERLHSGESINIVYNFPRVWKMYLAKN